MYWPSRPQQQADQNRSATGWPKIDRAAFRVHSNPRRCANGQFCADGLWSSVALRTRSPPLRRLRHRRPRTASLNPWPDSVFPELRRKTDCHGPARRSASGPPRHARVRAQMNRLRPDYTAKAGSFISPGEAVSRIKESARRQLGGPRARAMTMREENPVTVAAFPRGNHARAPVRGLHRKRSVS